MDIIMQTQKTYTSLQDNLSRKIYENRLLFSLTKAQKYLDNIINHSYPIEEYKQKVNSFFKNTNIVIFGAGIVGQNFLRLCDKTEVIAFCDSAKEIQGTIISGYNVISPEELRDNHINSTVVIAVFDNTDAVEITDKLTKMGFAEEKIINVNTIIDLPGRLRRAYFSQEIIAPLIKDNENFIDVGCYNLKTSTRFLDFFGNDRHRIIAFEPNPDQYQICAEKAANLENVEVYPFGLWSENVDIDFDNRFATGSRISEGCENTIKINAVKLDNVLKGVEATFIKMDIEGAELNALKGAEQTILKYRPKLAICVYHKAEDMWEIPAYILSLHSDYKLYLRHYSLAGNETVLYAV